MSKKRIIITAAAGLLSFAGAFAIAWLTNPSPAKSLDDSEQPALAGVEAGPELRQPEVEAIGAVGAASGTMKKAMTENQLKNLIHDVRGKMQQYDNKLLGLGVQEQRLRIAQDGLKKDIESLDNLRIELVSIVANLKSERDELLKSRLEISQAEKANLESIALTYDKMDASSASKILANMCADPEDGQMQDTRGSSFDDAVKILHYMAERTGAKLLAEIAVSEPALAATLCRRLKEIVEGK